MVGVALGYGLDRAVFRPLREQELAPYFASFGVAIALENVLSLIFGSNPTILSTSAGHYFNLGSARITSRSTRGTRIEGGTPHVMHPGDIVHIAAGTPHQTVVDPGKTFVYFVVKIQQ